MAASAASGAAVRERMTGEDTFWWALEGPHNPMVMLALLRFGRRPRRHALHTLFGSMVASHRRFRQRLVWVDVEQRPAGEAHMAIQQAAQMRLAPGSRLIGRGSIRKIRVDHKCGPLR